MKVKQTKEIHEAMYAEVILPLPFYLSFTYSLPSHLVEKAKRGCRVIVPFGKKKIYSGVIDAVHNQAPDKYEAKEIIDLPDNDPLFTNVQLDFLKWMGHYYMCGIGETLAAAMPSGLRLSSVSMVQLHPDYEIDTDSGNIGPREEMIIRQLQSKEHLSFDEIGSLCELKNPYPVIRNLQKEGAILIFEQVKERFKPKKITKVRLHKSLLSDKEKLKECINQLEKKTGQLDILMEYLSRVPVLQDASKNDEGLDKSLFKSGNFSDSSLATLIKNEIFEAFSLTVSRFHEMPLQLEKDIELSEVQQKAQNEILEGFEKTPTVLLHGITGSGKTEILIDLIRQVIESGHQVLYLMPEIALTTQMVGRLRLFFGSDLGIYHSRFSDNERVEVWQGVLSGKFPIVAGVRSSLFLPFDNLGLIIVDEEHESSYKQFDPAPRYHARDMALVLARFHACKTILSSATPSIESYQNALDGKYALVQLQQRYAEVPLPEILLSDIRKERKEKKMQGNFGRMLLDAIDESLKAKKQVILFQNRRGYAPYMSCESCGWIPKCESCSVSLTYHQYSGELKCHYCGFKSQVPGHCHVCESTAIKTVGFGTERIEEEVQLHFADAKIRRMDLDTTRNKDAYQKIIDEMEQHEVDILIGTQMVSKGLDFDKVALVGVMDADHLLHFPDFRAHEKAFQMLTQVAGRAGRKQDRGKVIIQSRTPEHFVLDKVVEADFEGLFALELEERRNFLYPPFSRLIMITLKSSDKQEVKAAANYLFQLLQAAKGDFKVLNPHEPLVSKIRNLYLMEILIKIPKEASLNQAKEIIYHCTEKTNGNPIFKKLRIILDVDPV